MLRQSALVFAGGMVLSAAGFASHAIASRVLGVAAYGALYALVSAYLIAAIPGSMLSPIIARLAAEFRALHDDGHLRGLAAFVSRSVGVLCAVYVIVAVALAIPFASFLRVPIWSAPAVGLLAGVTLFALALRGIVQGTQDFGVYAISNVVEGCTKVVAIVAAFAVGLRLLGGVAGFLIGPLIASAYVGVWLLRRYGAAATQSIAYDWRRIAAAGGASATITAAQTMIGSADVVLVRHFFPESQAGLYAASVVVGKILLYLVGFIPTVLLPQAADRHARGARTREVLLGSLAMLATISVFGLLTFHFAGLLVLHGLVGRAFDGAEPLLVPYGAAMVLLAFVSALSSYGIATHRLGFAVPLLLCAAATIGVIAAFHPTLYAVVGVLVVGNAVTAVVVAACLGLQWFKSERSAAAA